MRGYLATGVGLLLALGTASVRAQESTWRPNQSSSPLGISLGQPVPLTETTSAREETPSVSPNPNFRPAVSIGEPRAIVRAQGSELQPPPPPPPPVTGGPVFGNNEAYNCGVVGKSGGFFSRCGDAAREWWQGIPTSFQTGPGRSLFQSDTKYSDKFISPVSNPFYAEDPRALTEARPIFIWQRTPDSNYIYAGGDNFWAGVQLRLAITDWFSVVIPKLGVIWSGPENPGPTGEFSSERGFSEFHIGPKVTFIRAENFVMAAGFNFQIASGPARVFQDTGSLSLDPYLTFAVNFWETRAGTMIVQTSAGYAFGTTDERTDLAHVNLHVSYDVANLHKFYPLLELNWVHYTQNGTTRDIGFEGRDLFNFGTNGAAGHDDLTLAAGFRYKISECIQFGLAAEFSLLGGGRHMDAFRLTADMIFRY